jgi:hypothetical protein
VGGDEQIQSWIWPSPATNRILKHAPIGCIAVGCAVAQAGEAYDANGRLIATKIQHGNFASRYSPNRRLFSRSVWRGNIVQTYDSNGRLALTGVVRGQYQIFL